MTDQIKNQEQASLVSAIALLVFGLFVAAAGGGVMKMLANDLPPEQITWVRFFGYLILMIPICTVRSGRSALRPARPVWQVVRGFVLVASTTLFVYGVRTLDYADAIAILYAYPFFVVVMARLFLGERPPRAAWLAVFGGFLGVLLVVKPDPVDFNVGAIFVLICALFVAAQLTLNRFLGAVSDPFVTSMWGAFVATVLLSPFALPDWIAPTPRQWWLLIALAVMGTINQTIIVIAFTKAEAAKLAPFTYAEMVAGVIFGLLMFGTLPDALSWAGIALIIIFGVLAARSYAHRNVPKRNPKF